MSKWRDISSAPKDGRHILLWQDPFPIVAHWAEFDEIPEGGFWCPSENLIADVVGGCESTHWMPLPEGPK